MDMKDPFDIVLLDQPREPMNLRGFYLSSILPQLRWNEIEVQGVEDPLFLFTGNGPAVPIKPFFTQLQTHILRSFKHGGPMSETSSEAEEGIGKGVV
jgi:hypothetical protein